MVAVPVAAPVTTPVDTFTLAIEEALLLQAPEGTASDNVILLPTHTLKTLPVIAVSSVAVETPVFHLSPASAAPPFTALMTPRSDTLPVPEAGAVQGTVTT
jgi:hypothetical protein